MFTDLDRRTVANLAVPTNVEKLTHDLRVDPYTQTRGDAEVYSHLQRLSDEGLVRNLGEASDLVKLVAKLPKTVRQMPDDQAEIFTRRLATPRHAWRATGDLWVITQDGIDRLKQPTVESPPMTPSQMQAAVQAEWARTIKGKTTENFTLKDSERIPLANALLEDEFLYWFDLVNKECQAIWNQKLIPPLAGGAGWTDIVENRILNWENQKTAMPALVAPWFMKLTILAYTDSDTATTSQDGSHIPTYTGYAPASVAAADMNAASGGSSANANPITYAACTAGSSIIVGFGNNETNGTTGDFRKYGTCASTTVSTTQTPATFAAAAYTTTAD